MSEQPANGKVATKESFLESVKNNGGLVLAAFVGVANFVGISTGEVTNLLRNYEAAATLTGFLILLAITAALASSLIPDKPIWGWWLAPIYIAIPALAFLPRFAIKAPKDHFFSAIVEFILLGVLCGTAGIALIWVFIAWLKTVAPPSTGAATSPPAETSEPTETSESAGNKDGHHSTEPKRQRSNYIHFKTPLLIVAVLITIIATYSALRAEAISQSFATRPQITSTLTAGDDSDSLTVKVDVARLSHVNHVRLVVFAWGPASATSPTVSTSPQSSASPAASTRPHSSASPRRSDPKPPDPVSAPVPCDNASCPCAAANGCYIIGSGDYGPDQNGSIDASYNVIFPDKNYSEIEIVSSSFSPINYRCYQAKATYCSSTVLLAVS